MLWFTRGMGAIPHYATVARRLGERATVAPGGWLRGLPQYIEDERNQPCSLFPCLIDGVQSKPHFLLPACFNRERLATLEQLTLASCNADANGAH